ncbi:VOC family protein [Halomarina halobia]|uniref:VOC family protein n=1 Tax=Halomarina halobia TaxID=3033386 RepID=A0ABD6AAR4_9EURY|nr:VOC family protein [Halomarina sp. PSR21]
MSSASASRLGHVHLKVRDLDRAIGFYEAVLGLSVGERLPSFAFLSFGEHHHDLALQAVGPHAAAPGRGVGLYHTAWEVPDATALRESYETLRERGVEVSSVDHGISKALYFDDPDGNGVEVYLDTRAENDRDEWRGESAPFDPTTL